MSALNLDSQLRHVGDLDGAVLGSLQSLGDVLAHLVRVHIECGNNLYIGDAVRAELCMHQAGDIVPIVGVCVVGQTLNQRGGAVAQTYDCNVHCVFTHNFQSYVSTRKIPWLAPMFIDQVDLVNRSS